PLLVAATLATAASTTTGLEPGRTSPIPDSAFRPVVIEPGAAVRNAPLPTLGLRPLSDAAPQAALPERPQPSLPEPRAIVVPIQPRTTPSISGRASWYCNFDDPSGPYSICHRSYPDGPGFDAYAAAGPGLRAAMGASWRGRVITVCGR